MLCGGWGLVGVGSFCCIRSSGFASSLHSGIGKWSQVTRWARLERPWANSEPPKMKKEWNLLAAKTLRGLTNDSKSSLICPHIREHKMTLPWTNTYRNDGPVKSPPGCVSSNSKIHSTFMLSYIDLLCGPQVGRATQHWTSPHRCYPLTERRKAKRPQIWRISNRNWSVQFRISTDIDLLEYSCWNMFSVSNRNRPFGICEFPGVPRDGDSMFPSRIS